MSLALPLAALLAAQIFFSKSFPGSSPAYFEVQIEEDGKAVYREAPDDDPLRFEMPARDVREIFALAEKLQFFERPLESKLKVANMGWKTLRYQGGGRVGEQKFNYSEDPDARALVDWFERISETQQHKMALERTARYDRMGLPKALLLLEAAWDRNRLAAPEQLLPILDRIASQNNILHMARARAAAIAEKIRAARPQN